MHANICTPNIFAKLLKLDRFAWYHWMRKYLFYFGYKFLPRPQAAPDDAQLPKTSSMKNEKTLTLISQMAQNIELIMPRPVFFTSSEEWPNILHMLYILYTYRLRPSCSQNGNRFDSVSNESMFFPSQFHCWAPKAIARRCRGNKEKGRGNLKRRRRTGDGSGQKNLFFHLLCRIYFSITLSSAFFDFFLLSFFSF